MMIKHIGLIIGALSALASLYAITGYFETKGYNRAMVEFQSEANEKIALATSKAIEKAQQEAEKALSRQRSIFETELKRVENDRIVETEIKEVIKYVDKIEIKNECSVISNDILGLLNETINTVNRSGQ